MASLRSPFVDPKLRTPVLERTEILERIGNILVIRKKNGFNSLI